MSEDTLMEGANKPASRLLALPAEIRLQIWTYALTDLPPTEASHSHDSHLPCVTLRYSPAFARAGTVLRLLQTSRQVFAEAHAFFYSRNTLCLSTPAQLHAFLSHLSPRRRAHIASICVAGFGRHHTGWTVAAPAFALLALCPRLRALRVELGTDLTTAILDPALTKADAEGADHDRSTADLLRAARRRGRPGSRGYDPADRWTRWWEALAALGALAGLDSARCGAWGRPRLDPRGGRMERAWARWEAGEPAEGEGWSGGGSKGPREGDAWMELDARQGDADAHMEDRMEVDGEEDGEDEEEDLSQGKIRIRPVAKSEYKLVQAFGDWQGWS